MPLTRIYFDVFLDDDDAPEGYVEHRVEIRGGDQLRAELEGKKIGVSLNDSMHQTYLWAWASLVRNKLVDLPFLTFRDVVIRVDSDKTPDPETVDPTQPAAGAGSLSPSQLPTQLTGTTGGSTA